MDPLIEAVLTEQIAGLRASAGVFVRQRADALAAAEAAAVQEAGALARATEIQTALDRLRAEYPEPEEPKDEAPND